MWLFHLIKLSLILAAFADHQAPKLKRPEATETAPLRQVLVGEESTPHLPSNSPWPLNFFQNFSRSQDGQTEDAHFQMRFTATPVQPPEGGPRCIQVKFRIAAEYASRRTYYRRRLDTLRLFNAGNVAQGGAEDSEPFVTDEIRRNRRREEVPPIPRISPKGLFEIATDVKVSPVYISNGTENGEGEIVVACVREQGNYSGTIELKAAQNSPERITVPWSFRFEAGGISSISFRISEQAVPDPEEFMGDLHPRTKLRAGERLENVNYRLVNSSRHPQNPPRNHYQSRFPHPDSERETY